VEEERGRMLARGGGKLGRGPLHWLGRGKDRGKGGVWASGPKPEGRVLFLFLFFYFKAYLKPV